jgi:hypothetical protein
MPSPEVRREPPGTPVPVLLERWPRGAVHVTNPIRAHRRRPSVGDRTWQRRPGRQPHGADARQPAPRLPHRCNSSGRSGGEAGVHAAAGPAGATRGRSWPDPPGATRPPAWAPAHDPAPCARRSASWRRPGWRSVTLPATASHHAGRPWSRLATTPRRPQAARSPRPAAHLLDLAGGCRHPGARDRRADGPRRRPWRAGQQSDRRPLPAHHPGDGGPSGGCDRGAACDRAYRVWCPRNKL